MILGSYCYPVDGIMGFPQVHTYVWEQEAILFAIMDFTVACLFEDDPVLLFCGEFLLLEENRIYGHGFFELFAVFPEGFIAAVPGGVFHYIVE